ncbi:hypothetical protein MMC25_005142 [Agyrium rufum]|nr:hypothetical protein [Agyrium rufum]
MTLLKLPLEIRLQIYSYLVIPRKHYTPFSNLDITSSSAGFHISILLTNQQLYSEAWRFFLSTMTWEIEIFHNFSYIRTWPYATTIQDLLAFPHMRKFDVRIVLDGKLLSDYPSYTVEQFISDTTDHAKKIMTILGKLPGILVTISWYDTLLRSRWEMSRWILASLLCLRQDCNIHIGSYYSLRCPMSASVFWETVKDIRSGQHMDINGAKDHKYLTS